MNGSGISQSPAQVCTAFSEDVQARMCKMDISVRKMCKDVHKMFKDVHTVVEGSTAQNITPELPSKIQARNLK